MAKRSGFRRKIPASVRFEVLKRDGFACRYCGRRVPDVVLVLDHVHPVARGGTNDAQNLITSCEECNRGKGARLLSELHVDRLTLPEELRAFCRAREEIDMLRACAVEQLQRSWMKISGLDWAPADEILNQLLREFPAHKIADAIEVAAPLLVGNRFSFPIDYDEVHHDNWPAFVRNWILQQEAAA